MLETNIRIVEPGMNLCLNIRSAKIEASHTSSDLRQKACTALKTQRGLAAIPSSDPSKLLVLTNEPFSEVKVKADNWCAIVDDCGETQWLRFQNPEDRLSLSQLIERQLLIEIEQRTQWWRLNNSPRIWYEENPLKTVDDIDAYRRYEISAIPIDGIGVGLVVDIGTAFFTTQTLADFFQEDLDELERKRRQRYFERLSLRQKGQKATLWYDSGYNHCTCYFENFLPGITCATPKEIRVDGHTYKSLLDYYQKKGNFSVQAEDTVALVSFKGIDHPTLVAANKLRLRVMNEALPKTLKQMDKIEPAERRKDIEEFWKHLGQRPLGEDLPHIELHFWQPPEEKVQIFQTPNLIFGQEKILSAPHNRSIKEYKDYYSQRLKMLNKFGCWKVPPTLSRTIYIRVPSQVGQEAAKLLGQDIADLLSKWTSKPINPNVEIYDSFNQATLGLRKKVEPELVVFVFENEDPASYFNVVYELPEWRVKRITAETLKDLFIDIQLTENTQLSNNNHCSKKSRKWQSFIEMNALEILQLMDCIPWGFAKPLNYAAQLAIDVGWDQRHFALSLLTCFSHKITMHFKLNTVVDNKTDSKKETINPIILRDKLVELFQAGRRKKDSPINKVLILRDGRECGEELEGITAAQEELIKLEIFSEQVSLDVVDVHKSSAKGIRLWDKSKESQIRQVLEGTALFLDHRTVILANTGAPTLCQGTADPIMLVANGDNIDLVAVAEDVYATSHLNWSNPRVAQRLPLTLKRTDDELENRAAQDIRLGLLRAGLNSIKQEKKVGIL